MTPQNSVLLLFLISLAQPVMADSEAWVTAERLNRRTCPSTQCGILGVLMFRERATVYEEKNSWARVSEYYDAACRNGRSEYVDSGNTACTEQNGIVAGRLSEWVHTKYLSETRPAGPGVEATDYYELVSGSDDYRKYKEVFARSASKLIASGRCAARDFQGIGGWVKSTTHKGSPVYFTYCGGMGVQNRLYLNAATGGIFQ